VTDQTDSTRTLLAELADHVAAVLDGTAPVDPPVRLAAALKVRGINSRITIRHPELGPHEIGMTLDDGAARVLAHRVEASDLGLLLLSVAEAFTEFGASTTQAAGALLAFIAGVDENGGLTADQVALVKAEITNRQTGGEQQA
jgi:hypothetical protein